MILYHMLAGNNRIRLTWSRAMDGSLIPEELVYSFHHRLEIRDGALQLATLTASEVLNFQFVMIYGYD